MYRDGGGGGGGEYIVLYAAIHCYMGGVLYNR